MEIQTKIELPDDAFGGMGYFFPAARIPEIAENTTCCNKETTSTGQENSIQCDPEKVFHDHDYVIEENPDASKSTRCNIQDRCKTIEELFGEGGVKDCAQCGTMFCNLERMIQHMMDDHQHEERIFRCKYCHEYFPRFEVMTHLQCKHGGQFKEYPTFTDVPKFNNELLCVFCEAKFSESGEFVSHMNREHNPELMCCQGTPMTQIKWNTGSTFQPNSEKKAAQSISSNLSQSNDGVMMKVQWLRTVHVPKRCQITSS